MKAHNNSPMVILDTPNILYYKLYKGEEQIANNLKAIVDLIMKRIRLIPIITPKMEKSHPTEFGLLRQIIEEESGRVIYSQKTQDPDRVILEMAINSKVPIITNDKFRQPEYKHYSSVKSRLIQYYIRDGVLIPRKTYWKNYLWRVVPK